MPRYFFHSCLNDQLRWDTTARELPNIASSDDAELTVALWSEVLALQCQKAKAFVITDEAGKVLFVAYG